MYVAMQEGQCRDKPEKEAIHSGHFMVSHFEAEEQDDEDDVAVPVPETEVKNSLENIPQQLQFNIQPDNGKANQQLSIETSLSKLFQCMSLAYRQKLTSPKWNRFRGIRLRWKDKIRLNNVIWRCWHMQFIMKQNTLICQFASPLDVDQHNKPEAVVLEGKYWKRKLQAVTAEYKKWRMYYRARAGGCRAAEEEEGDVDGEASGMCLDQGDYSFFMMVDEDYRDFMSDTLFSTIANQPFVFPDSREIARAGLADFIQPSLGPLQPNLDDIMDTLEPLNELINAKLPAVPEEQAPDPMSFKPVSWDFPVAEYQVQEYPVGYSAQPQPFVGAKEPAVQPLEPKPALPQPNPARTYKFGHTGLDLQPNFKFTAQNKFDLPNESNLPVIDTREAKCTVLRRGRSRSTTREEVTGGGGGRPPLMSAASDPALLSGSGAGGSALLTQLLTRRSSMTAAVASPAPPPPLAPPPPPPPLPAPTPTAPDTAAVFAAQTGGQLKCEEDLCAVGRASPESEGEGGGGRGDRRSGHIHAEQKRRYNIKNGFDMIHSLIPQLAAAGGAGGGGKLSKAAMLQKGAEYIRQLRGERAQLEQEMGALRGQIERLNASISTCQSLLPATGAPVSHRHHTKMHDMFDEYVRRRTHDDWKFWLFSLMVRPLLASYNSFVSSASLDELYRSTLLWVEQHCTLVELRPIVLNSLRHLCTKTDILAHPEALPLEARRAVDAHNT